MLTSPAVILESLSASGLLSADDARAVASAQPPLTDGQSCLDALVKRGALTSFQAQVVLEDRQHELVFGEYIVLDHIGSGGMGEVYKAMHRRMQRVVAIKRLPMAAMQMAGAVERFYREVKAAAKLTHPNIVAAYDAGEAHGSHFLVMEFIDGKTLSSVSQEQGPLPVDRAITIIREVAVGLAYAHGKGVIHRDIKPANILMASDGAVKLLDMGLARVHETGSVLGEATQPGESEYTRDSAAPELTLTQEGRLMGTVEYMAPEQATDAHDADARADIYSLGCTLYRILTGKLPFDGKTAVAKIMAHSTAPIPLLTAERPDVPESLELIYLKMVAKKPEDRYQTMLEVISALGHVGSGASTREHSFHEHSSLERSSAAVIAQSRSGSTIVPLPAASSRRWLGWAAAVMAVAITIFLVTRGGDGPPASPKDPSISDVSSRPVPHVEPTSPAGGPGLATQNPTPPRVKEVDLLAGLKRQADGAVLFGKGDDESGAPKFFDAATIPLEYDLELHIQRDAGGGRTDVVLIVGGNVCAYRIPPSPGSPSNVPRRSGLGMLDGRLSTSHDNPSAVDGGELIDDEYNILICQVRKQSVKTILNGKAIMSWTGDPARLSPFPQLKSAVERRGPALGLVQWGGTLHCRKAVMRVVE